MARRFKLREIERARGKPLESIIVPLVNRGGQKYAADSLNVSQSSISAWLQDNGYTRTELWQKKTTPQEQADIDAAAARINARRIAEGLPTLEEEAGAEFS